MLPVEVQGYYVELTTVVQPTDAFKSIDDVEERIVDPLLEAFEGVEGPEDVDLGFDLAIGQLTISMFIEANTQAEALAVATAAARTAIHATGGHTPGWDGRGDLPEDAFQSSVRPADLIDC